VAGRGELPESLVNSCAKFGVQLEHVGSGEELSDSDIAAALDRADVLLAPYRNVTESASALVAMAWGLPTLGYSSGALVRLLNNKSRVAVNDSIALAERLEKFRLRPWPTYQETLDALTIKCIAGWGAILAAAAEGSSAPSKK
jgi:glycosyltransferase involved in cell wall biosynthesis